MNLHIVILVAYALAMIVIGLVLGRAVKGSSGFFVANRQLGPGLLASTLLAANIGAGSTVGATGIGYTSGVAAWWWVGSAGLGSIALAFWIGPAMRRVAARHDLKTVGDYLEFRYSASVRGLVSLLLWVGSIFILAAQIFAMGTILDAVAHIPTALGCLIGGLVITVYFAAGGLATAARVNVLQLAVKLGGFAIAVPLAVASVGGWDVLSRVTSADPGYWSFWRVGPPGLMYLALFTPPFIVSPGLLQKVFGARDDRAVRIGVGINAMGLLVFAAVPAILGVVARSRFPDLAVPETALAMVLVYVLPPLLGAVGLAAVFSAEISAADASLFMLTTSLSQDLYKRFLNPTASDRRVLFVARATTVVAASLGVMLAIVLGSVVNALSIFYTLLGVSLFVPIIAGLYMPSASTADVTASIVCGVLAALAIQFGSEQHLLAGMTPALAGLLSAALAFLVAHALGSRGRDAARRPTT